MFNPFIGLKAKLYGIGAAIISILIAAAYFLGRRDNAKLREAKDNKKRLDDMKKAKEIDHEVGQLDDDGLRDAAGKWVRGSDD